MDEQAALAMLAEQLGGAGDDTAIIDGQALTIDMLHETTDFPPGTTSYTAGWRTVGASVSDVAAMGAEPVAAVGVYAAPEFETAELTAFIDGAVDVCEAVGADYVGGDLDHHEEFTAVAAVLGNLVEDTAVTRDGATPGDRVCITGTLGRSGAALEAFDQGDYNRANTLFQFQPRVAAGRALAPYATAMIDSSDGLARSVHQIATASACGMAITSEHLPIDESVEAITTTASRRQELGVFFGEDFELVCTIPPEQLDTAQEQCPVQLTEIGEVTDAGVQMDGTALPNRGYDHGTA